MRRTAFLAPLALIATPAAAAPSASVERIQIPRELLDPALADRLTNMIDGLSNALLNLPVGEVQAAAEGRSATPQEKRLTVRDIGRRDDPNFERDVAQQIAAARPVIHHSMQAFARSLPAITKALSGAADEIERAAANMPRADYPRR